MPEIYCCRFIKLYCTMVIPFHYHSLFFLTALNKVRSSLKKVSISSQLFLVTSHKTLLAHVTAVNKPYPHITLVGGRVQNNGRPLAISDQSTGLTNQTCNHSATHADQFLVEVYFSNCCIHADIRSDKTSCMRKLAHCINTIQKPNEWLI